LLLIFCFTFSAPSRLYAILLTFPIYTNTQASFDKIMALANILLGEGLISAENIEVFKDYAEGNLAWMAENSNAIENWLSVDLITDPPTTLPTTDAPTTLPVTDAPTTLPATDAPTTLPATDAPTTQPATDAPTTQPATDEPTTLGSSSVIASLAVILVCAIVKLFI